MSILLAAPTTADYDLTSAATVLSHAMAAAGDVRVMIRVGTIAKPCVALAGVWKLYVYASVGGVGYNLEAYPQEILTSASSAKLFASKVLDVPSGATVGVMLLSPNIGDSDVTVTAEIWHVSASLPAVAPGAVGGLPVLDAAGYVEADAKAVRGKALSAKAGTNFDVLFQNGNADSTLTLTGATGIATAVWAVGTRTLTSFGTLVADVATAVWGAVARTLTAVTGLGLATEAKQDTAQTTLDALHGGVSAQFESRNVIVPASGYVTTGAVTETGVNAGAPTRTFISMGHRTRIRQNGTITKVVCEIRDKTNAVSLTFAVFRYEGGGASPTFTRVCSSEAIAPAAMTLGTWNEFTLATPLTGVQAGDFLGCVVVGNGGSWYPLGIRSATPDTDGNDWQWRWKNADATGTGIVFDGGSANSKNLGFGAWMPSPVWASAGESFAAGHDVSRSFLSDTGATAWHSIDPIAHPLGYAQDSAGDLFDFTNTAQGSTTAAMWSRTGSGEDLITNRCLPYYPRAAFITLGANDAAAGTTVATYMGHIDQIAKELIENDILPVFCTTLQTMTVDPVVLALIGQYNIAMAQFCNDRGLLLIDGRKLLGTQANEDVRDTASYGSGTHPNAAGYQALGVLLSQCGVSKLRITSGLGLALENTLAAIKGGTWTNETLVALKAAIDGIVAGSGATAEEVRLEMDANSTKLARILGMTQENFYIDSYTWSAGQCTGFRMRIYSDAASVGTAANVIGTYTVTATYAAGKEASYKVVKV